jgi:phosphoribosyl 1,2-cyclic phosphodiesterase
MEIYFWGTRGSLPYSVRPENVRKKIELALKEAVDHNLRSPDEIENFIDNNLSFDIRASYGCNTSCVEFRGGTEFIICDAGSGLRDFGNYVMSSRLNHPVAFHIFISHLHWDHINGFPFFLPANIPGNTINIYGFHDQLEPAFINQQEPPFFPLPLEDMKGDIKFHVLDLKKEYHIAGVQVKGTKQIHPSESYGYCFEKNNKKFVYSTDAEHQEESEKEDYFFLEFIKNADLLVFDAQYKLVDHFYKKRSWGHSSNMVGVEIAVRANVKHLCLFHNDQILDDHQLERFLIESRRYLDIYDNTSPLKIDLAYDGLEIRI